VTSFRVKGSKVKVTKLINAGTENQTYLRNGKAYNFRLGIQNRWSMMTRITNMHVCMGTSKLKAVGGCSSHHFKGVGAYCGGRTTGRTA